MKDLNHNHTLKENPDYKFNDVEEEIKEDDAKIHILADQTAVNNVDTNLNHQSRNLTTYNSVFRKSSVSQTRIGCCHCFKQKRVAPVIGKDIMDQMELYREKEKAAIDIEIAYQYGK